jgi:hypothetical protein
MKMLNFIIDTSVFALPPKSLNPKTEVDNLTTVKKNILYLEKLRKKDTATVSYINKALFLLKKSNYPIYKSEIASRIEELRNSAPQYCDTLGHDGVIFEKWDEIIRNMIPRKDRDGAYHKGNIGIFSNIPDREKDPDEKYTSEAGFADEDIYPELAENIRKTFKKYCGYIADLNRKYDSSTVNFFVIGDKFGEKDVKDAVVILKKNSGEIQSHVSIVGIQKAETLCETEIKFKNLVSACEEGRKKFSASLVFGKEIKKENIEKDLFPQAGPPSRVYHYLETLCQVSKIITTKNIDFDKNMHCNLVEMLNAHGLLCSPDDGKYIEHKCQLRKYENESGKKMLFNIHLKPSTYTNKNIGYDDEDGYTLASKETVRIYLEWDNDKKKMRIGWIGHHPSSCRNCGNGSCKAKAAYREKTGKGVSK